MEERTSQLTDVMHELNIILVNALVAISKIIDRKPVWVYSCTGHIFLGSEGV